MAAVSALTPLLIAIGLMIRWLGKQIWAINRLLATQNEAIKWQNTKFESMRGFDSKVAFELEKLEERLTDLERYLELQSLEFDRPFSIRGRDRG